MAYNAKDIEVLLGIPTRRIQFYVESGLVSVDNPGRGRHGREFSRDNLLELALIKTLSKSGIDLSTIKKVFENIRKVYPSLLQCNTYDKEEPIGAFIKIFDGGERILFSSERERHDVLDGDILRSFTGGPATSIKVDLSKYDTVMVVSILNVYNKIIG